MFSKEDVLLECVPNFSEGRNASTIDAIARVIHQTKDVQLLHTDIGFDANRTVFTFVGKPHAILEAGFQAVQVASQLIDLSTHQGSHPRMGACDVFPIIPLQNCTMKDVIMYSRQLGERIGTELGLPVYLYEHSAQQKERQSLAFLRKGEYESISEKINFSEWKPDYGPYRFNPSFGMMALGARNFLIAYNVNLNTKDEQIAKKIASKMRAIRKENKGSWESNIMQHVKAIGWYMDTFQCAQVSTNITDIYQSKILDVFQMIQKIASEFGVDVMGSELIGLIPKVALEYTGKSADEVIELLGLNAVKPFSKQENILEYKLGISS